MRRLEKIQIAVLVAALGGCGVERGPSAAAESNGLTAVLPDAAPPGRPPEAQAIFDGSVPDNSDAAAPGPSSSPITTCPPPQTPAAACAQQPVWAHGAQMTFCCSYASNCVVPSVLSSRFQSQADCVSSLSPQCAEGATQIIPNDCNLRVCTGGKWTVTAMKCPDAGP